MLVQAFQRVFLAGVVTSVATGRVCHILARIDKINARMDSVTYFVRALHRRRNFFRTGSGANTNDLLRHENGGEDTEFANYQFIFAFRRTMTHFFRRACHDLDLFFISQARQFIILVDRLWHRHFAE